MTRRSASALLGSLQRMARRYGSGLAPRKLALLRELAGRRLETPRQLLRFHELLCLLDAYPDDRVLRSTVRRILRGFANRPDLRRHRAALAGTGIAGTDTPYRFYWPTAAWIARVWPRVLELDRSDEVAMRRILEALPPLLYPTQAEYLRRELAGKDALRAIAVLKPRAVTDAEWLIRLVSAMPGGDAMREAFYDRLDPPLILRAGRDTPERTTARLDWLPAAYRTMPLDGARPDLRQEVRRAPRAVVSLDGARANALIRAARISMLTRERDLEAFQYASRNAAFLVNDGQGLAFGMLGMRRSRRAALPAIFGGLILQNGVPAGYVQADVLGRHAEVSFNTFEAFRGGEAGRVFLRLLAALHHLFGCDSFSIEPYQLGLDNEEGIRSGAWWFYHRAGFRPSTRASRAIAARELRRRARDPGYRSPARTLRALSRSHLYLSLAPRRAARLPRVHAWLRAAAREIARHPPLATRRTPVRWAGLIAAFTRRGHWTARERRELRRLAEAKEGSDEREYLRRMARHAKLRRLLDC